MGYSGGVDNTSGFCSRARLEGQFVVAVSSPWRRRLAFSNGGLRALTGVRVVPGTGGGRASYPREGSNLVHVGQYVPGSSQAKSSRHPSLAGDDSCDVCGHDEHHGVCTAEMEGDGVCGCFEYVSPPDMPDEDDE